MSKKIIVEESKLQYIVIFLHNEILCFVLSLFYPHYNQSICFHCIKEKSQAKSVIDEKISIPRISL